MHSFRVAEVPRGTAPSQALVPIQDVVLWHLEEEYRVHGCGARKEKLARPGAHAFVDAVGWAFDQHLPLILSPDDVWLLIAQGFANKEREQATNRQRLTVRRDDFLLGRRNPWHELFSDFSRQIRSALGDSLVEILVPEFSTTGVVERAAAEVVLMGAVKNRFEYEFMSLCGIPEIRLLGCPDDWSDLRIRARRLCEAGELEWWWRKLEPVLAEFVKASRSEVNRDFWNSIFKRDNSSGGPYISGWINVLIPFLVRDDKLVENARAANWSRAASQRSMGPTDEELPSGLTSAPVRWRYLGQPIDLNFCAGFVGIEVSDDGAIRPGQGWFVVERDSAPPL